MSTSGDVNAEGKHVRYMGTPLYEDHDDCELNGICIMFSWCTHVRLVPRQTREPLLTPSLHPAGCTLYLSWVAILFKYISFMLGVTQSSYRGAI